MAYQHRVAILPRWMPYLQGLKPEVLGIQGSLDQLYAIEWAQHDFPYYNIQSLDLVQMRSTPEDLAAFDAALHAALVQDNTRHIMVAPEMTHLVRRRSELTNTRYT